MSTPLIRDYSNAFLGTSYIMLLYRAVCRL